MIARGQPPGFDTHVGRHETTAVFEGAGRAAWIVVPGLDQVFDDKADPA